MTHPDISPRSPSSIPADIRRRALRAAFAVTVSTAMLGCVGQVVESEPSSDETAGEDHHEGGGGGSSASASASTGPAVASPVLPLLCTFGDGSEAAWAEYSACCQAVQWDFNKGCEAWGPPMPPSMDWKPNAHAEVA